VTAPVAVMSMRGPLITLCPDYLAQRRKEHVWVQTTNQIPRRLLL
jgi:hypothetical protein